MSRSIVYNGTDFSPWTTAKASLPAAHGVAVEAAEVPGRPGAVLLSAAIPPKPISVRLFLDLEDDCDAENLSGVRRALAVALASTEGAELELPGEPGLSYRDVFCTDASEWSHLFEDGSCELSFLALDPVAWGEEKGFGPMAMPGSAAGGGHGVTLDGVSGTAPAWPVFELVAATGGFVEVHGPGLDGPAVSVERAFAGGEEVVVDCLAGRVRVDGEVADADVAIESRFFCLDPDWVSMGFVGCSSAGVSLRERWY